MNVELNGEVASLPDGATVATAIEASGAPTQGASGRRRRCAMGRRSRFSLRSRVAPTMASSSAGGAGVRA